MLTRLGMIAALVLGLTACRGGVATTTATPTTPTVAAAGAAPTAREGTPPVPCGEATVRGVVRDFIAAFNAGDRDGLARVFPPVGADGDHPWAGDLNRLRWFSLARADPGRGVDALTLATPEELLAYFAARHARHERLRLVDLTVNPDGGVPGGPAILFRVTRTADDLPERMFGGKGGVNCAHGTIFLWSQGAPFDGIAPPGVPRPAGTGTPPGTPPSGTPTPSARQARALATVVAFLAAYNAGDLDATRATLAEPWGWSDCDDARRGGDGHGPGGVRGVAPGALRGP